MQLKNNLFNLTARTKKIFFFCRPLLPELLEAYRIWYWNRIFEEKIGKGQDFCTDRCSDKRNGCRYGLPRLFQVASTRD